MRKLNLLALGLLLGFVATQARAQSILTVAGGGTDDGRLAIAADLNRPVGLAVAPNGDLYIADWLNQRVRKVAADTGVITTVAGNGSGGFTGDGGPATEASIDEPMGVALDPAGNLYIADMSNARIRRVDAKTGIITTFAGGGGYGFAGDGGPATAAKLGLVSAVAIGPAGDVYIADSSNNRVRKVSTSGIITTIAGSGTWGFSGDGGPATAASLELSGSEAGELTVGTPTSLAVDSTGVIYISDTYSHRVRKVDASGTITTLAGNGTGAFAGDGGPAVAASLRTPAGLTLDSSGGLLICDSDNFRVRRVVLATGAIMTIAGSTPGESGDGGPAVAAQFVWPAGIAQNAAGDVFVSDQATDKVRRIAATTTIVSTYAGLGVRFSGDGGVGTAALVLGPAAMAIDSSGAVTIAEYEGNRIRRLAADGRISTIAGNGLNSYSGDNGPAVSALLSNPGGVALDSAGSVYFADISNNRIRRIAAGSGIITTIAGTTTRGFSGDGGPATAAAINLSSPDPKAYLWAGFPSGVVVDTNGDVYFADTFNYRIRKIAGSTQIITTIAGTGAPGWTGDGGPAAAAQFDAPTGLALDRNQLYVADTYNHRIRRIDLLTGTITTYAGSGGIGSSTCNTGGDGGPATSAGLCRPRGVAVDAAGSVFIADTSDLCIRKITSGTITTIAGRCTSGTGFTGDGGRATSASLSNPYGVAVDRKGNVYIADTDANRVRVVYGCVTVAAPTLSSPSNGAMGLSTAPSLTWSRVEGAFRYDVYLSASNPPALIASDVTATTYAPSNLIAGTTYYWRVISKGDPFCVPPSSGTSEIRAFTTASGCDAPASLDLSQPPDGASGGSQSTQLSWSAAAEPGRTTSTSDLRIRRLSSRPESPPQPRASAGS